MAIDHVKSTFITNLDASPAVINTAGEGGAAPLQTIEGYATSVVSSSTGATYQLVRVPSNAKIKSITFESAAMGGGTFDLGVFYATDGQGNQPTSLLVGTAMSGTSNALFATAIAVTSASTPTDVTNEAGIYTINMRAMPIWQAAGLTSDPGGSFDIVASVQTGITNAARFGIVVTYTL